MLEGLTLSCVYLMLAILAHSDLRENGARITIWANGNGACFCSRHLPVILSTAKSAKEKELYYEKDHCDLSNSAYEHRKLRNWYGNAGR